MEAKNTSFLACKQVQNSLFSPATHPSPTHKKRPSTGGPWGGCRGPSGARRAANTARHERLIFGPQINVFSGILGKSQGPTSRSQKYQFRPFSAGFGGISQSTKAKTTSKWPKLQHPIFIHFGHISAHLSIFSAIFIRPYSPTIFLLIRLKIGPFQGPNQLFIIICFHHIFHSNGCYFIIKSAHISCYFSITRHYYSLILFSHISAHPSTQKQVFLHHPPLIVRDSKLVFMA